MTDGFAASLAAAGASENAHGRIYEPGRSYSIAVKLEVADKYESLTNESRNQKHPSARALAKAASVSPSFAQKIIDEIHSNGRVLAPDERVPHRECGVGSISLDEDDERYLLYLRFVDPSRSNRSYVEWLRLCRGTRVSESLISEWFKERFAFSGSFRGSYVIPIDKFKPDNIKRYQRYIEFVTNPHLYHRRIKFGDEK